MLNNIINQKQLPRYRIEQFNKAYYQEYIKNWDELTTYPKQLREQLKAETPFNHLELKNLQISKQDNTHKALFKTPKGNYVETVLMQEKDRNTVCVSCMSGCPVGCTFCATGSMGLNENLDHNQIVEQVLFYSRILKKENKKVTNIVYMGMGEPMLNLDNVTHSIKILIDSEKFGISRRHITVSTCGYIQQLEKFLKEDLGVKIAISLHAPNQELRDRLMPTVSKTNPLEELMNLLDRFVDDRNKRITYEYVLLKGINDTDEHAEELSDLLYNRLALVNLIDYNSNPYREFEKSNNTENFMDILLNNGINTTLRKSYGNDIAGACGQLAKQ